MKRSDMRSVQLLFICSMNQWRSRTAEELYRNLPGYVARSAGTAPGAKIRVTAGHIGWADWIFVMETKHRDYLQRTFADELEGKEIVCLRIPDDFTYNDPQLIDLLKASLASYIDVPNDDGPSG